MSKQSTEKEVRDYYERDNTPVVYRDFGAMSYRFVGFNMRINRARTLAALYTIMAEARRELPIYVFGHLDDRAQTRARCLGLSYTSQYYTAL